MNEVVVTRRKYGGRKPLFNEKQKDLIVQLFNAGCSLTALAAQFGCSSRTISNVLKERRC